MISQGGGLASRQGGQQELDRIGAFPFAEQNRRLVGLKFERLGMVDFLAIAVKTFGTRPILATVLPLVVDSEFEFRQFRLTLDRINGFIHPGYIHPVYDLIGFCLLCRHCDFSLILNVIRSKTRY